MASFNRTLSFANCGTPALSRKVDATNANDGPNLYSKFFDDIVNSLSCYSVENFHAMILCKNMSLGKTSMKLMA
jgi:transcription elongation factor Elf1